MSIRNFFTPIDDRTYLLNDPFLRALGITAGFAIENFNKKQNSIHRILADQFGKLVVLRQKHGSRVVIPAGKPAEPPIEYYAADASLYNLPGKMLTVHTADCLPILVYSSNGVIGAIHAGWRSTLMGIAKSAVHTAGKMYGAPPRDLKFVFMPGIGKCCMEVGHDVAVLFKHRNLRDNGKPTINISGENKEQLMELGVPESNFIFHDYCTKCFPDFDFPSFRKDGKVKRLIVNFIFRKR
ncbi:MAG: hypothetical protein GF315_03645 [candidate division Zixibacteria bacterium]|nr:hypothetical protein [candidate division Zixibacteria bacterium]